ncbi:hypothetical protein [Nakamurella lactea]|uniref:hypothetical protein n=1 Tax=Nakamurella lactea TaxID=459515 RepID=UPI000418B1AE|nr:hypothetical protein [Nakamurella lactea]
MLLLVTGSSCSGKSTAAAAIRTAVEGVAIHDSDEHGVPSDADTAWRQGDLRRWVRLAIALEAEDTDLLLTGQSPIGELLAIPEASRLELAVCLIDVQDRIRSDRLEQRDPGRWPAEAKEAFNNWARWHRCHAEDPSYQPEVITEGSAPDMRWDRWRSWHRWDPRWSVTTIDASEGGVSETASALRTWVQQSRDRRADRNLPLGQGWCR